MTAWPCKGRMDGLGKAASVPDAAFGPSRCPTPSPFATRIPDLGLSVTRNCIFPIFDGFCRTRTQLKSDTTDGLMLSVMYLPHIVTIHIARRLCPIAIDRALGPGKNRGRRGDWNRMAIIPHHAQTPGAGPPLRGRSEPFMERTAAWRKPQRYPIFGRISGHHPTRQKGRPQREPPSQIYRLIVTTSPEPPR